MIAIHREADVNPEVGKSLIVWFGSPADLYHLLHTDVIDAVVTPTGERGVTVIDSLCRLGVVGIPILLPVLAREELALRQIRAFVAAGFMVNPVFGSLQALETALGNDRGLRPTVLRQFAAHLADNLVAALMPALILGVDHITVADWEQLSPLSGRAIRRRLALHKMPSPHRILGALAGVGVSYRSNVLGLSLSDCARQGGFDAPEQMREYLKRSTSLSSSAWRRLGIDGALAHALEMVFSARN